MYILIYLLAFLTWAENLFQEFKGESSSFVLSSTLLVVLNAIIDSNLAVATAIFSTLFLLFNNLKKLKRHGQKHV